jgi:hypothetical protein
MIVLMLPFASPFCTTPKSLIPQKQFVKWPESFCLVDLYASWNPAFDHCAVVTIASLMVPGALVGMTLKILLGKPILKSSDQQVRTHF